MKVNAISRAEDAAKQKEQREWEQQQVGNFDD
jgi:hypothetical protein